VIIATLPDEILLEIFDFYGRNIMMIGGIRWYMYAEDGEMWYLHHHGAWTCDFAAHAQDP
jgi:hypothetical protein